jgi:hypothetical protein
MESRVSNLIEGADHAISRKKARQLIRRIDAKEARWHRSLYRNGHGSVSDFDLVIDVGVASIPEACSLIHTAVQQPEYKTTLRSLEVIDLLSVAAELRARIAMRLDVGDRNVEVEHRDGVIAITGSVGSAQELHEIRALLDQRPASSADRGPRGLTPPGTMKRAGMVRE